MADQQIAVLIDYENVGPGAIQWVLDQVSDLGRVIVRRAYGDWASNNNHLNQLLELGIEPVQMFRATRSGKNSSDMRLVIDAIELLYQSPVDTFVIVSSDTDFVPLVRKLRSAGKSVIGAGRQATASRVLVTACDRYFYVADGTGSQRRSSRAGHQKESLLVRAVRATMDEQGRALGTRVHQTMQRLDPAFDFRALGYSTFSRYLEASPEVAVTRPRGPGDIIVEHAEKGATRSSQEKAWDEVIDEAWHTKAAKVGSTLSGRMAATIAAQALGAANLRSTQYRTLQGIIQASELLKSDWDREGNQIVRRR